MITLDHYADPERKLNDLHEANERLRAEKDAQAEIIAELASLLKQARSLGLTFYIGNAYIRRAYITEQDSLRARIKVALEKAGAA